MAFDSILSRFVFFSPFPQLKSDYDRGDFSIKYILSGEGAGEMFEINEYSGEIRTLQKLDREEKAFYLLQAHALARKSNEPVEPQSEFIIKVQDINDNIPQFQNEPYVSSIPEMCPMGMFDTSVCGNYRSILGQPQSQQKFEITPPETVLVWAVTQSITFKLRIWLMKNLS